MERTRAECQGSGVRDQGAAVVCVCVCALGARAWMGGFGRVVIPRATDVRRRPKFGASQGAALTKTHHSGRFSRSH